MAFAGTGKSVDQFQYDDAQCRNFATLQVDPEARAANDVGAASAVVGTIVGGAAGAAIGAAAGDPATGAAVGAGVGLLGGSVVGADQASRAYWSIQQRYDAAYTQCMYDSGNRVPVPRSAAAAYYTDSGDAVWTPAPPPPRGEIPKPPPGRPPPPPPDVTL
jgi:uncharacterized protein YcfJ